MDVSRTFFFCCIMVAGLLFGAVIGWNLPPFHLALEKTSSINAVREKQQLTPQNQLADRLSGEKKDFAAPADEKQKIKSAALLGKEEQVDTVEIEPVQIGPVQIEPKTKQDAEVRSSLEPSLEEGGFDLLNGDVIDRQSFVPRVQKAGLATHNFPRRFIHPPRSNVHNRALTKLIPFETSPFPYEGVMPLNGEPFLNHEVEGRLAHKTGSGRVYYADETYNENRVVLHIPQGFDASKPAYIVLFFHGHGATLERDIIRRQRVPQQLSRAGVNAVLVAPQFAKNARDSSPGNFWQPGAVRKFVEEAEVKLASLYGGAGAVDQFKKMPILIIGYSGGFLPTAWAISRGGISERVRGIVLMDGFYGHQKTFTNWITQHRNKIFISAYTGLTAKRNTALQQTLDEAGIPVISDISGSFQSGAVVLARADEDHRSYLTNAWTQMPIKDVLLKADDFLTR